MVFGTEDLNTVTVLRRNERQAWLPDARPAWIDKER